jgi:type VI secretion system secreted protein VgrG
MEELTEDYETHTAAGTVRGLMAGCLFSLIDHPWANQNKEYLVVSATHNLDSAGYESGVPGADDLTYGGSVEAIDAQVPYRSPRSTPKPLVQGPQTAVVVGPSGEEIWTDKYGRVKLQFHWDRYGESNENSSCWVRVAQVWAGKNWGAMHIPRMGQEVIVEFLEGDPDRPIITGRVYNADQMPPYELPANQTQSGIKSRSTKGGDTETFNEIRFEDIKGDEHMYIHAEKDQMTVVENDQAISVGNDRAEEIGRDRSLTVGRHKSEKVGDKKSIQVGTSHTEQIGDSMTITVGGALTESVAINYAETVGAAMELTVGAALTVTAGGAMATTVGGVSSESIGSSKSSNVGTDSTVKIGKSLVETIEESRKISIGKDVEEKISGKYEGKVDKEFILNVKKLQFVAKDQINIKTGSAELIMKKNGDITVKGKKINIKGSSDVIIKGSKVKEN